MRESQIKSLDPEYESGASGPAALVGAGSSSVISLYSRAIASFHTSRRSADAVRPQN
jgi:hypothetical protein